MLEYVKWYNMRQLYARYKNFIRERKFGKKAKAYGKRKTLKMAI